MNAFSDWALARLGEPSTYSGLAIFVASMTFWPQAAEIAAAIPQIGAGVIGLLSVAAILLPERGKR